MITMTNLNIRLSEAQLSLIENLNRAAEEMIKTKFPEEVPAQPLLMLAYKMGFIDCLKVQNHEIIANLTSKSK